MCGPGYEPDAALALPQASIAVMGPEAAVNAVYYNKIQERPEGERAAYVEQLREQYRKDVDIYKLAADLHVDAIVPSARLREELLRRFAACAHKRTTSWPRKRAVVPV
jgi:acetyl-CoA carboxylase carboxyltransferase component